MAFNFFLGSAKDASPRCPLDKCLQQEIWNFLLNEKMKMPEKRTSEQL